MADAGIGPPETVLQLGVCRAVTESQSSGAIVPRRAIAPEQKRRCLSLLTCHTCRPTVKMPRLDRTWPLFQVR